MLAHKQALYMSHSCPKAHYMHFAWADQLRRIPAHKKTIIWAGTPMTKINQMFKWVAKYTIKKAHVKIDQINTDTALNSHRFPHHRALKTSKTMQHTGTAAKKTSHDQEGADSTKPKEKNTMEAISHTVTAEIPVIIARFRRFLLERGTAVS